MPLLDKVTCPHCWAVFETHSVLWLSTHPSLIGDPRLGRDAQRRFLPTRFTSDGLAMDEMDSPCHRIACPSCHLEIPRVCTEMESWIVSIIGAPAAGKSFYLGAVARTLRNVLPSHYRVSFTDSDANLNRKINSYEQAMFGNPHSDSLIPLGELIEKTTEQGDQYSTVFTGNQRAQYPHPYTFTIRPDPTHPKLKDPVAASRVLCLYDNAGESYLSGSDSTLNPVTRHLAQASMLLFLFDPTQDHDFRRAYLEGEGTIPTDSRIALRQQQTIVAEAANRVRLLKNMPSSKKHDKPLFVIVTKQDLWGHLVPAIAQAAPLHITGKEGVGYFNADRVTAISVGIREMMVRLSPAVVDAAESFAQKVVYVGASSLGMSPTRNAAGEWVIRPRDIKPEGVEVPFLHGLNSLLPGLFPAGRKAPATNSRP